MTDIAEKELKKLYDEYVRTGDNDYQSINTSAGIQLESLGLVKRNVLCEFILTSAGIEYMEH